MDPKDDLSDTFRSLSLGKPDLLHKPSKSLNKPHVQTVPGQFQFSNDFLQPISVKSKQWNSKKIDVQKLQTNRGSFAKYAGKHVIHPPEAPKVVPREQLPPAVLGTTNNFERIEAIADNIADEADTIRT